jgi:hypothetical protein
MLDEHMNKIGEAADELHYVANHKYRSGEMPYFKCRSFWVVRKEREKVAAIQHAQSINAVFALRALFIATRKKHRRDVESERELEAALISYLVKNNLI